MDQPQPLLAQIWFFLLGFILWIYVILDGFDLGVGVLSLGMRDSRRRGLMMASLGTLWHANQTWLVVLGGVLFGAFPLAYGVMLSGLYLPILLMLFGLICRSVSFEFAAHSQRPAAWQAAFGLGSLTAALAQGFALGGWLSGLPIENAHFAGSFWGWLSPFAVLTALILVLGYVLLGAAYLISKTEGEVQQTAFSAARASALLGLPAVLAAAFWAWRRFPYLTSRWVTWPDLLLTAPVLLGAAVSWVLLWRSLQRRRERAPYLWTVLLLLFGLLGLGTGLYPYILPPAVTLAQAAAPAGTLAVMLTVIGLLLPVMLLYNAYQYRVFTGKAGEGYKD